MKNRFKQPKRIRKAAAKCLEVMQINRAGVDIVVETLRSMLSERYNGQTYEPFCRFMDDYDSFQRLTARLAPIVDSLPLNGSWTESQIWLRMAGRCLRRAGTDGLYDALVAAEGNARPPRHAMAAYRMLFRPDRLLEKAVARADAAYAMMDQEGKTAEDEGIHAAIEQSLREFMLEHDVDDVSITIKITGERKLNIDEIRNDGRTGQGDASKVMQALCRSCDRWKVRLTTTISTDGAHETLDHGKGVPDDEALAAWLGRLGFQARKRRVAGKIVMTRRPHRKARSPTAETTPTPPG